jgi:tetratricopeptide (TPR) repeat protein
MKTWIKLSLVFLCACNFSSSINKEILEAQSLVDGHRYNDAIRKYEQILKKNPETEIKSKIFYQLAKVYSLYLNQPSKSEAYYQSLITTSSDPILIIKAKEEMADLYFAIIKDYNKSIDLLKELTSIKPRLSNYELYEYQLALSYYHLKNYEASMTLLNLISKNPNHEFFKKSFYFKGISYFERSKWNEAIEEFKEYIRYESEEDQIIKVKFLIANCYETLEKLKAAYELYYSLLGKYPTEGIVEERLQSIYQRRVARKR